MKLLRAAVLLLVGAAVPALAQRTPVPTPTPRPTPRATVPPPPPTATPVPPPPTWTPTATPLPSPGPTQAGTPAPSPAPTPAPTSPPGASPTATPAATPSLLRGPAQFTISVKNAPAGARARLILTAPDNSKRHTFEVDIVGATWATGVSINGFPSGSYAELLILDPLGNVVNRETTTLP